MPETKPEIRDDSKSPNHDKLEFNCGFCGIPFSSQDDLYRHQKREHDPDGIVFSDIGLPK